MYSVCIINMESLNLWNHSLCYWLHKPSGMPLWQNSGSFSHDKRKMMTLEVWCSATGHWPVLLELRSSSICLQIMRMLPSVQRLKKVKTLREQIVPACQMVLWGNGCCGFQSPVHGKALWPVFGFKPVAHCPRWPRDLLAMPGERWIASQAMSGERWMASQPTACQEGGVLRSGCLVLLALLSNAEQRLPSSLNNFFSQCYCRCLDLHCSPLKALILTFFRSGQRVAFWEMSIRFYNMFAPVVQCNIQYVFGCPVGNIFRQNAVTVVCAEMSALPAFSRLRVGRSVCVGRSCCFSVLPLKCALLYGYFSNVLSACM